MRPVIEFCVANSFHGTDDIMRKLEADQEIDVIEYGCLGNCGECYMFPFALVNGEIVFAETTESLYTQIMRKVREIQAI